MLNKQSIVLFGVEDKDKKAVLSLEIEKDNIQGKLRLYNFDSEPKGILTLGITSDDGVIKAGLTKSSNMLFTFGAPIKSFSDKFSCAVINFVGGQPSALLFGSCENKKNLEDIISKVSAQLKSSRNVQEIEEVLDENGLDYDEEEKQYIENLIDKNLTEDDNNLIKNDEKLIKNDENTLKNENSCPNCENCIYKKYFYENAKIEDLQVEDEEDKSENIDENENHEENLITENEQNLQFYNEIKNQIDVLFQENGREEFLQQTIENSQWVKVEFGSDGEYYVFGLIYSDDRLKYIGYGVPGVYSMQPKQMSGYPTWLPVNKDNVNGFGYWISYQDADTGESVKAIVE